MAGDWESVRLKYSCPREPISYGIMSVDLAKVAVESSLEVGVMVCWVLRWRTRVELVALDTRVMKDFVSLGRIGWGMVLPFGVREVEHHHGVVKSLMKHLARTPNVKRVRNAVRAVGFLVPSEVAFLLT